MKTIKKVISGHSNYKTLINNVVNNLSNKEDIHNIYEHGIAADFGKFVYYDDTVKFWRDNRKSITALLEDVAEQMGDDMLQMVCRYFNYDLDLQPTEVAKCIYGRFSLEDRNEQIYNVLTWFAAEEVCRWFMMDDDC